MTKFETKNSTYEINEEKMEIRRVTGKNAPTDRFAPNGEWKKYAFVSPPREGYSVFVNWGDGHGTLTSPVASTVALEVVRREPPERMFAHFRIGDGHATLCAKRDAGGYAVAVALCSPRDQFARKRGRSIAEGRLLAGEVAFSFAPEGTDDLGGQLRRAFVKYLKEAKGLPRWVVDDSAGYLWSTNGRHLYLDTCLFQ